MLKLPEMVTANTLDAKTAVKVKRARERVKQRDTLVPLANVPSSVAATLSRTSWTS